MICSVAYAMPACFIAAGLSAKRSTIAKRVGSTVFERLMMRVICFAFVTGMIPAMTGTRMSWLRSWNI